MDSATKFRRAEIELIKKNLENQLVHYCKTSAKFKRWHTHCQTVCALIGGVATILTGSGLAASLSAVGVVVGGPLIATATLFSLVFHLLHGHHQIFPAQSEKTRKNTDPG